MHPIVSVNMENVIYCSPQNDKLCVAGWYCCMIFGSSLSLAGLAWLLNFKESKEGKLNSSQGIYVLSRLFPCVEVLSYM